MQNTTMQRPTTRDFEQDNFARGKNAYTKKTGKKMLFLLHKIQRLVECGLLYNKLGSFFRSLESFFLNCKLLVHCFT